MSHHHPHETLTQEAAGKKLSPQGKLRKMVEYWMHHNEEHARSYRDWANRARELGQPEVGQLLERLAGEAVLPNHDLEQVLQLLKGQPASH